MDMAKEAKALGLKYCVITEHTGGLHIARGLQAKALEQHANQIRDSNKKGGGFTILAGCEVNIKEDGNPDIPNSTLSKLDVVVASIHGGFKNSPIQMTKRICTAMENPHVDIIGHPTGRLIPRREGYSFDAATVFETAKRTGTALEINSQPARMDLEYSMIREAKRAGVTFAINSDAHAVDQLQNLKYGVANARRGWCEKKDVLNTLSVKQLLKRLK